MTATDIFVVSAIISILIAVWVFAWWRVRAAKRSVVVPKEVREQSHEVANEVMKVRAGLHKISKSPDPIRALVGAMTGTHINGYDRHH